MSTRIGGTVVAALVLALVGTPGQGAAQEGVSVVAVRGLEFGPIIPGAPESIRVDDAARRAEVMIGGTGAVDVVIILPDAMTSPQGRRIPLRFDERDGAVLANASLRPVPFNPRLPVRVQLTPTTGPTRLLLGGTAVPANDQQAGAYSTTITVMLVDTGI